MWMQYPSCQFDWLAFSLQLVVYGCLAVVGHPPLPLQDTVNGVCHFIVADLETQSSDKETDKCKACFDGKALVRISSIFLLVEFYQH